jgi:hypothetical protein
VYVDQPTVAQTVSILRGLRERYEVHHGVRISDSALVEAAVLSDRYLADRCVPASIICFQSCGLLFCLSSMCSAAVVLKLPFTCLQHLCKHPYMWRNSCVQVPVWFSLLLLI